MVCVCECGGVGYGGGAKGQQHMGIHGGLWGMTIERAARVGVLGMG